MDKTEHENFIQLKRELIELLIKIKNLDRQKFNNFVVELNTIIEFING